MVTAISRRAGLVAGMAGHGQLEIKENGPVTRAEALFSMISS
jgi:hypothetical protein